MNSVKMHQRILLVMLLFSMAGSLFGFDEKPIVHHQNMPKNMLKNENIQKTLSKKKMLACIGGIILLAGGGSGAIWLLHHLWWEHKAQACIDPIHRLIEAQKIRVLEYHIKVISNGKKIKGYEGKGTAAFHYMNAILTINMQHKEEPYNIAIEMKYLSDGQNGNMHIDNMLKQLKLEHNQKFDFFVHDSAKQSVVVKS